MFSKADKRYPVYVEQGTERVPSDGRYHVLDNDKIVLSTAVHDYALITFEELVERHRVQRGDRDPKAALAAESANREMTRMRREAVGRRQARNTNRGTGGT